MTPVGTGKEPDDPEHADAAPGAPWSRKGDRLSWSRAVLLVLGTSMLVWAAIAWVAEKLLT